jgi:hypothetical protein
MLKRKGQIGEDIGNGSTAQFARAERAAYTATFEAIRPEFEQLTRIRQRLDRFEQRSAERPADSFGTDVSFAVDGVEWQSQVRLLKMSASEIFLCCSPSGTSFAVIQQFQAESPYAKANGNAEILLHGDDASQLVRAYATEVRHTLRFMASNLVAKAQRVAWEQFPEQNPDKVVRAISKSCQQVAGICETVIERVSVGLSTRQARGIRV